MLDRAGPIDFPKGRLDDEELLAGNNSGQQDCHAPAVLAARVVDDNHRIAADRLPALGWNGDVETATEGCDAAHASVPSWSVIVMVGVMVTERGRTMYFRSPASSSGDTG